MSNWMLNDYYHYREDSGIVYRYDFGTTIETILYNFNLVVGDSIIIDDLPGSGYAHVSHIDSTLVCGSYRRTIHFATPPDVWVEGIGSLYATFLPLEYYYYTDGWFYLLCVNDSACQLYQNPEYTECYIDTTYLVQKEESLQVPLVQICPNPVELMCRITISGTNEELSRMILYDIRGEMVRNEPVFGNSLFIERKDLPSGLYFVKLISEGRVLNEKVIFH